MRTQLLNCKYKFLLTNIYLYIKTNPARNSVNKLNFFTIIVVVHQLNIFSIHHW